MDQFLDFFLHLDKHIESLFVNYQGLTYFILCLILFCETGLVIMPLLPGDSLLFAVGATVAKIGVLNLWLLIPMMIAAVLLGDNVNYFIGNRIGTRLFDMKIPFLKRKYLDDTHAFYEKHGGKTVIMARFVPIVRTFAPFVAGLGAMTFRKYISNCIIGAVLWVTGLTLLGYSFGQHPFVKEHFELVILGIIGISLMPPVIQYLMSRFGSKTA